MGERLSYTQLMAVRFCHGVLWLNAVVHVDAGPLVQASVEVSAVALAIMEITVMSVALMTK